MTNRLAEYQLTEAEAIQFSTEGRWERMDLRERAVFQFGQRLLCMPFDKFHEAATEALGRPVWTHEFAFPDTLWDEIDGRIPKADMDAIISKIPAEKLIILEIGDD